MSIVARIEENRSRRGSTRRKLRLEAVGQTSPASHKKVLIHDISLSGLLIESSSLHPLHGSIEVELPEAGIVEAKVVWTSGIFFGCRFKEQISQAALSATLLRADRSKPHNEVQSDAGQSAVVALRELSYRVQQLCVTVERIIEELDKDHVEQPRYSLETTAFRNENEVATSVDEKRLSFSTRMQIILGLSVAIWALIFWAIL